MTPTESLLPRLMPLVMGCPRPMALQALVDAAIDFCESTEVLKETLATLPARPGENLYDVDLPTDLEIARLNAATRDDRFLLVVGRASPMALGATVAQDTEPRVAYLENPRVVGVVPADWRAKPIVVQATLRPTRAARALPDELADTWTDAVVYGAAAKLASTPGQAFTNFDLVALWRASVDGARTRARLEANAQRTKTNLRVQMRPCA